MINTFATIRHHIMLIETISKGFLIILNYWILKIMRSIISVNKLNNRIYRMSTLSSHWPPIRILGDIAFQCILEARTVEDNHGQSLVCDDHEFELVYIISGKLNLHELDCRFGPNFPRFDQKSKQTDHNRIKIGRFRPNKA